MSAFLGEQEVATAIGELKQTISGMANGQVIAVAVFRPTAECPPAQEPYGPITECFGFTGLSLDRERARELALTKAKLALRHKMDTLQLRNFPHLLETGDCWYPGGVYRYNGIAVGVSGSVWQKDHMFASWIAEACFCLSMTKMRDLAEKNPDLIRV